MNYFIHSKVAKRYAKGRPNYHANTIKRVAEILKLDQKLHSALDIACGTGLSTFALLPIASNVFGTDSSPEMIKNVANQNSINYFVSSAEKQPFDNESMDLITVASGVHWFEIDQFLSEVKRLLKPNGKLILYDNFFLSKMENNPSFSSWYPENFLQQFPAPPRNDSFNWSNESLQKIDLNLLCAEEFENIITFSKLELIAYLTTQSNVTSAVDSGKFTYQEIEKWLDDELSVFYTKEKHPIYFGNWLKIIGRKML